MDCNRRIFMTAELIHRLHFAFTITFHYLFPQLTMGLALLIVVLKSYALKTGSEEWDRAARFWGRKFGINFVFGVVTGIPMEFEFGTNWARFSQLSGGVIGQPLAMEGVFSFFLESAFLGLFLYGERRISKLMHWFSSVMVFVGSWISGYFIIVTDAWMQHPVAYDRLPNGQFEVLSFWQLLLRTQYDRRSDHRLLRHERRGRFLSAGGAAGELRAHLSQGRRHRRRHRFDRYHFSDRRSARQVCRAQPASRNRRHGGSIPNRVWCGHGAHRTA
jgi:cytochrome bd-type quinol oxidase subunit 1